MYAALQYVFSQEYIDVVFVFSLLYFCLITISALIVFVLLFFVEGNSAFLKETKIFFCKLPLLKKIVFCYFCVFGSFPNKVYVNNGFTFFENYFLNCFLVFLCFSFSPFLVLFFLRFMFIVESIVFGLLYEYSSKFQTLIVKIIFSEDKKYTDAYILYFYGNPSSSGVRNFFGFAAAMTSGYGLQAARHQEVSDGEKQIQESVRSDCDDIIRSGGSIDADGMAALYEHHEKRTEGNRPISTGTDLFNQVCRDVYTRVRDQYAPKEMEAVKAENELLKLKLAEMESKQLSNFSNGAIPINLKVGSDIPKFGSLEPKKDLGNTSKNTIPFDSKVDPSFKKLDSVPKSSEIKVVDVDTFN